MMKKERATASMSKKNVGTNVGINVGINKTEKAVKRFARGRFRLMKINW